MGDFLQKQICVSLLYKVLNLQNTLQVGEDHTMEEMKTLKLGNGLSWMKNLMILNKSFIKVVTKMVERLVHGIFFQLKRVPYMVFFIIRLGVDSIMKQIMELRSDIGLNQMRDILMINKQLFVVSIILVIRQEDGIFYIEYHLKSLNKCNQYIYVCNKPFCIKSGGGLYDEQRSGLKIQNWIELVEGFQWKKQVTYRGQFENGRKIGRWDIYYKSQQMQQLGEDHLMKEVITSKMGFGLSWIQDLMMQNKQLIEAILTMVQKLVNGIFVTKIIACNMLNINKYVISGGGSYDEGGESIKIGYWTELDKGFCDAKQVIHRGEFQNGRKIGKWDIFYKDQQMQQFYISGRLKYLFSGGGYYDGQSGNIKIGKWTELDSQFNDLKQLIILGQYQNDKKVGKWVETRTNIEIASI
ncbi:unnamed protein product [Paramecium octaurelia]|uniref:Uncharacterized protein n=1 Tax=Paramecium octaurelia TaxID=43137 RepID=A0A8S1YHS9_PAROT|nr:unnamed protein product [Paramecium octaurelia]